MEMHAFVYIRTCLGLPMVTHPQITARIAAGKDLYAARDRMGALAQFEEATRLVCMRVYVYVDYCTYNVLHKYS